MSVPSSVQYFASKLADYELTPISLDTLNGLDSFKENNVIEFELPSSSVVDLDSIRITFGAFCDGNPNDNTLADRLPEDIHKLIRRVEVSCGSELLGHAYDEFGRLKHHLDAITGQAPHATSHPRILRQGLNQASPSTAATGAENEAAVSKVRYTWDRLGGFLETAEPRMMDLAILPPLIVRIHTAGREALTCSSGDATPAGFVDGGGDPGNYTIKSPRLTFDAVSMGAPYDSYVNAVLAKKLIQIPFKTYRHYQRVDYKNGIDVATGTRSLDRVFWAMSNTNSRKIVADPAVVLDVEYTDPDPQTGLSGTQVVNYGEKYHASRFLSSYDGAAFNEIPDVDTKYSLTFNGIVQPNRHYDSTEWFTNTTNSLSEYRNPWNAGLTFPQWLKQNALCCYRLNRVGSTVQTASGVDTRNSVVQMQIQTPMGLSVERQIDVWLESTALLSVSVGREFTVEM